MKATPLKFGTILVATDLQTEDSLALRYGQAIAGQLMGPVISEPVEMLVFGWFRLQSVRG